MKFKQLRFITSGFMQQYRGGVWLCVLSLAFASALLMSTGAIRAQAQQAFSQADCGFNAVIGPRGSRLQLVLNSLFHLDQSVGVMPWHRYQAIKQDRRVEEAYPITVGDNYRGFRIVGCERAMFEEHHFSDAGLARLQGEGVLFDPYRAEAVLGSFVARELELELGDTFHSYHGLEFVESEKHDLEYTVVGILEPSNTPLDRAIWVPLESYYRMPGHALHGSGEEYIPQAGVAIPDEHKEVSAVLCRIVPSAGFDLNFALNRSSTDLTFAFPVAVIVSDLFDQLQWVEAVLGLIALLVFLLAAMFMITILLQHLRHQERDFLLLRSLGARRFDINAIILLEALRIGFRSVLCAFVCYAVVLGFAAIYIRHQTGVYLSLWYFDPIILIAPILQLCIAIVAAILPALHLYARQVHDQLQETQT